VRRAVDGMEVVYHLGGAFQGGGPFSEQDYFEINVRGTFHMLEAARADLLARALFVAATGPRTAVAAVLGRCPCRRRTCR